MTEETPAQTEAVTAGVVEESWKQFDMDKDEREIEQKTIKVIAGLPKQV